MKTLSRRLAGLLLLAAAPCSGAAELGVLVPPPKDRLAQMRARPDGKGEAPVLVQLREGKLYEALQQEAARGTTAQVLKLDELAMRIAGQPGHPTWLMVSQQEGGFARHGFWLQSGGELRWMDDAMVDLVVNEATVADGSFEEIFAHELGHVMLRRLVPQLPAGYSRTPHHSYSITDQPTAFDEGWATHFQGLARRLTVNPRLRAQDRGLESRPFLPLWQSNLDRETRIEGMRQNWFVHRQADPGGPGEPWARIEQSTLFDRARLKSAAQMLASEGVVATFFYRQLAPSADADLVHGYDPMLRALHALGQQALTPDTALIPQLAIALARVSPDEGRRFVRVLVETSYGALLSPQLAQMAEAVGRAGRFGDAEAFVPELKQARAQLDAAATQAMAQPDTLLAQAGPAVWLLLPARKSGEQALAVDLNTAELEHLMALPGITKRSAERALASRRSAGNFSGVADFADRAGLDLTARRRLESMQQALRQAGTFSRE